MKTVRRISNRYYVRQILACFLAFYMLIGMPTQIARAVEPPLGTAPNSGNVISGSPVIPTWNSGTDFTANPIINTPDGLNNIVMWNNFDIASNAIVTLTQNGGWVLNDVQSVQPTSIYGGLTANNCGVIVQNPLGVVFGPKALVEAKSFVATSLLMDQAKFLVDDFEFGTVDGDKGNIELKNGAIIKAEEYLGLIGKKITSHGTLVGTGEDTKIIIAAADKVYITEDGSNIMVKFEAGPLNELKLDGEIKAEGTGNKVSKLVLAAGDIWSGAIIGVEKIRAESLYDTSIDEIMTAYAEAASDAVASIDITTGGHLTIKDKVSAIAEADDGASGAIAEINVEAGDGVTLSKNGQLFASAETMSGPADATATVNVDAGGDLNIDRINKKEGIEAKAVVSGEGSGNATADVVIDAQNVHLDGSESNIAAKATTGQNAGNASAMVDIAARGDFVSDDSGDIFVKAETGAGSGNATATLDVTAAGEGEADGDVMLNPLADFEVTATTESSSDAVATVNIEAEGDVYVAASPKSDRDGIFAYAETGDGANNSIADISILAGGNVTVTAPVNNALAQVRAESYNGNNNAVSVAIDAGGDVLVLAENGGKAEVEALAMDGVSNIAGVDIDAEGDVEVKALCHEQPSEAEIMALAKDGVTNLADVDIAAGGDVVVLSRDGGQAQIEAIAKDADISNTANINILAEDGYVLVHGIGGLYSRFDGFTSSEALIGATAEYAGDECEITGSSNNANITIVNNGVGDSECDELTGDVLVIAVEGGKAEIEAIAKYGDDNAAAVDIDAQGDVEVMALCMQQPSEAEIMALAKYAHLSNTADITIDAGGDVKVKGEDRGKAEIEAIAKEGLVSNTATIDIMAGDDVKVIADGWMTDAWIAAVADPEEQAEETGPVNTAEVTIAAGDDVKVIADHGDAGITADTSYGQSNTSTIDIAAGDDVKVIGKDGGEAEIAASAEKGNTNIADVAIDAGGDVKVIAACMDMSSKASITAEAENGDILNQASVALGGVGHKIGGDVIVKARDGGEAEIAAEAKEGNTNDADVLICTEGTLEVLATEGSDAEVKAKAMMGEYNTSSVGIGAEDGIIVAAAGEDSGASIESKALFGYDNKADLIACTDGSLGVLAFNGGSAEIASSATFGYLTDAFTAVCATGDIFVAAADLRQQQRNNDLFSMNMNFGMCEGTSAKISSEAWTFAPCSDDSTANAQTHVVSKQGGVVVAALSGCRSPKAEAGITSSAMGAMFNSAYTGVAAGAELSPVSLLTLEDVDWETFSMSDLSELIAGDVLVGALGWNSEAKISSLAAGGYENDAMTVVCAPGKVVVASAFGGEAKVFSGAFGSEGSSNSAQTKVYAGDGEVGDDIFTDDIVLLGEGADVIAVTPEGFSGLCISEEGDVVFTDGEGAQVIVGNYASRTDCPDCPPCPCEGEEPVPPPAPLYREAGQPLEPIEFAQGGCPALMAWFADEVGLPEDQIHVILGGTDYLATDIQPCEACARLKQQADAMAGLDPDQVNAWASAVGAGLTGPITPEMITGIRTALADNPAAASFDEAAAEYVRILSEELGIETDQAVALVTGNYAPDHADLGAYINARLSM